MGRSPAIRRQCVRSTAGCPIALMQAIAAETTCRRPHSSSAEGDGYRLRWFTPTTEVELCGHATLASAAAIFARHRTDAHRVVFRTEKAGELIVTRDGDLLALDFPASPTGLPAPEGLARRSGMPRPRVLVARYYLAVYEDSRAVARIAAELAAVARLDRPALIVTAPVGRGQSISSRASSRRRLASTKTRPPARRTAPSSLLGSSARQDPPRCPPAVAPGRQSAVHAARRPGQIAGRAMLFLTGTIEI